MSGFATLLFYDILNCRAFLKYRYQKREGDKSMKIFGQKQRKQVPIYKKLFMIFSSFALIPVVFIGILSCIFSYHLQYGNLKSSIRNSLIQTGMMVDAKLEEMEYVSKNFTSNSEIKRLLRLPKSDENILRLQQEMDKFSFTDKYTITLCGKNGMIYTNWYTDGMIYRSNFVEEIKRQEWYSRLEVSGRQMVCIPKMENVAGYDYAGNVVTLAQNIVNNSLEGEDILGFVMISVPTSNLSGILKGVSGYGYVVDERREIVIGHVEEEIAPALNAVDIGLDSIQKLKIDGDSYLACVHKNSKGDGFHTVILTPSSELYSQIGFSVVLIGIGILLSISIIFVVAYCTSKILATPILSLESGMKRVQGGNLEKISMETDINELNSLKNNFNLMVDRVENLIQEKITEEKRRKEFEVEKAKAELKFLRAQITPHFLFNTLNSIKWLAVIHGASPVEEMIAALGRLLECSMQRGNDFIPLETELENVKAYLKIQEMRYGDRIHSKYEIEEETLKDAVPKLVLQPLVENAIIHGIDKSTDGGMITIRCYHENEKLMIEVEDDGPGIIEDMMKPVEAEHKQKSFRLNGIGVSNVNKRIQLIYGERYGLLYQKPRSGHGTLAILVLKREEEHAESTVG